MKRCFFPVLVLSVLFVIFGVFDLIGQSSDDRNACEFARKNSNIETWAIYLKKFPNGECSFEATQQIKKIKKEMEEKGRQAVAAREAENIRRDHKIGNLEWSSRSSNKMIWQSAINYCQNLNEGGHSDWRLPNIDELRTLLIADRVSGRCKVSESNNCLSANDCWSFSTCTQTGTRNSRVEFSDWGTAYTDGRYSRLGDGTVWLWSSSTLSGLSDFAWVVDFSSGYVGNHSKDSLTGNVRCVR